MTILLPPDLPGVRFAPPPVPKLKPPPPPATGVAPPIVAEGVAPKDVALAPNPGVGVGVAAANPAMDGVGAAALCPPKPNVVPGVVGAGAAAAG